MADFYVDLGVNTDADAQSAAGTGTSGDPFNARAFFDRAKATGLGDFSDEYLLKGQAFIADIGNYLRTYKLSAWDKVVFGNWSIKVTTDLNFDMLDNSNFSNGYMEGKRIFLAGGSTSTNLIINPFDYAFINSGSDLNINGCTILGEIKSGSGGSTTANFRDTIHVGDFSFLSSNSFIYNATNCVFTESLADIISTVPGTFNDIGTSCEYEYGITITYPSYTDTDRNLFKVDPAITINGSGVYTGYEEGMFGNPRPAKGLGASYFPVPPVGGGGFAIGIGIGI